MACESSKSIISIFDVGRAIEGVDSTIDTEIGVNSSEFKAFLHSIEIYKADVHKNILCSHFNEYIEKKILEICEYSYQPVKSDYHQKVEITRLHFNIRNFYYHPIITAFLAIKNQKTGPRNHALEYLETLLNQPNIDIKILASDALLWYYEICDRQQLQILFQHTVSKIKNNGEDLTLIDICHYLNFILICSDIFTIEIDDLLNLILKFPTFLDKFNNIICSFMSIFKLSLKNNHNTEDYMIRYILKKSNITSNAVKAQNLNFLLSIISTLYEKKLNFPEPYYIKNNRAVRLTLFNSFPLIAFHIIASQRKIKLFNIYNMGIFLHSETVSVNSNTEAPVIFNTSIQTCQNVEEKNAYEIVKLINKNMKKVSKETSSKMCSLIYYLTISLNDNHSRFKIDGIVKNHLMNYSDEYSKNLELINSVGVLLIMINHRMFEPDHLLMMYQNVSSLGLDDGEYNASYSMTSFCSGLIRYSQKFYQEKFFQILMLVLEQSYNLDYRFCPIFAKAINKYSIKNDQILFPIFKYLDLLNNECLFPNLLSVAIFPNSMVKTYSIKKARIILIRNIAYRSDCILMSILIRTYAEIFASNPSEVLQISANQIIQQILLILHRENIICSHVVKALVDFIDSQPNASNLYSNIRIKPFSFLVKMQQIYLLGALFYMLNSADSTNHLVGPKLKADITFQLNFHSIDETKLIDEISFLSLVVCVQKKTKPAHYEDILDKCTKMIKSTRLVSIFGWQLAALLAPFLNESNNEYILFFINKLFVDLQANQGIKHIYENFLARFFSSDGFHNIDLKIKDSILGQLLELPRNYINSTLATEFLSFASFQSPVYKILEHKGATKNINFLLKVRKNFQNLEDYLFYKLIKHTLNILDTHFSAVFTTPDKSNEIFIVYAKYFTKVICIHGSVLSDADMNDCFNVFFDLCKEKSPTLCLICSVKIYNLNRISPKELKKIFKLFDQLLETITMDTLVIMVESLLILSPSIIRVEDISKGRSIFDKLYGFIFLYNLPEHIIHFLLLYCINLGYKSTMPFYPDVVSIVMKYIQSDIFNPKFAWLCFKIIRLLSQHIYTAAELSFFYQYALKLQYHCRNLIYSIHDWLDSKKKLTSESDEEWFTKSADKYSLITLSSTSFYDFLEKNETNSFIYGDIDSNNKENIEKDQDLVDLNEINDYLYNENPNLTVEIILDIADRLIKIFMSYPPLNSVNIKNLTNFGIKTMILKYQMLLYALKKPDDHKRLLFSIVKYIIIYSTSKCIIKGFCDIIDKSVMCSSILLLDNSIFDNNLYDKFSPQLQLLLLENLKPEGEIEEKCRLKTLKYLRVHFKSFGYSNMSRLILSNCAVPANLGSLLDEILLGKGFEIENNETYHHLDSNTITFFKNINHLVKGDKEALIKESHFSQINPFLNDIFCTLKLILSKNLTEANRSLLAIEKSILYSETFVSFPETYFFYAGLVSALRALHSSSLNFYFKCKVLKRFYMKLSAKCYIPENAFFKLQFLKFIFDLKSIKSHIFLIMTNDTNENHNFVNKCIFNSFNFKALNNGNQESTEQLNELEMFNFDYQKNYPNLSLMQNNGMREYIKRTFEPFLLNSDIYPKQVTSGVMKHFLQFINWNIEKNSDSITIKIILELLKDLNKGGKNCKDMVEFWLTTVALSQFMIEIVVKKPESLLTCFKDVLLSSENNKSLDEVNLNYLVDQFIKKHVDSMLKTLSIGISSSSNHVMQFLLRIIKVLLEYEDHIYLEVSHYLLKIDQAHWINVIPQLMICLKSKNKVIVTIITEIITNSAKNYPEPFVTALIATKSSNPMMAETIDCILYNIEIHDPFVVGFYSKFIEDISRIGNSKYKQAKLLLQDLHKTLGEKKQKTELMLHLNKLNKLLNSEFVTLNEQAFITKYRSNLEQILRQGASFLNNGNITLYNQEGSSQNHNNLGLSSIDKYLKNIESLIKKIVAYEAGRPYYNLYDCTKWLMNVDWSMMVMPGTKYWEPGMEKVFIKSIRPNAKVFMSKRRPCVVTFVGTDDKEYNYIIKYDEDLRQDERIMQFFDLINSFIKENEELYAHRFLIHTYAIIPLGKNIGLIQHIDNIISIDSAIKENRRADNSLNHEQDYMTQTYNKNSVYNNIMYREMFKDMLRNTQPNDLYDIMIGLSNDPCKCFRNRKNFVVSCAIMSIICYVIGLGDRHPDNILIHIKNFHVIHIDFGDCFDRATQRTVLPETVPFRLTRMMIKVFGELQPLFEKVCIDTLSMLKKNKSQINSVLNTFVNDPLKDPVEESEKNDIQCENLDFSGSSQKSFIENVKERLECSKDDGETVKELIRQATSSYNLTMLYKGWMAIW